MKKILGILGTITISGSGMAGLLGNAPASAKNEINSLQTNNLENLKRNKRQIRIGANVLTDVYQQNGGFQSPNDKRCQNWVRKIFWKNGNHSDCNTGYDYGDRWHEQNCTC
ncbi:hypothetical protein [Spiroplasma endosymbiont of Eupeodes luniger]|uniref:hypothetical protein n=1 Tax=Spiroplasma endosymbiont of Eupeodes luniger TaxID=3066300 RepID=UPI0030D4279E